MSGKMEKTDVTKIEIPDIVVDPKDPKRKFRKGKFLGRVSRCASPVTHFVWTLA